MCFHLLGVAPILLAWLGWYWLCREWAARGRIAREWQVSWALACLGWGLSLTLLTQLASLGRHLNVTTITLGWSFLSLGLFSLSAALAHRRGFAWKQLARGWSEDVHLPKTWWPFDILFMLTSTGVIIVCLAWFAFSTPTTNADSLTYHLPRVMHWLQNGSVEQFPTGNCRQNEFGPWSGYALANFQLLANADRFANMVQWFAMLTSVIMGGFIARLLTEHLGLRPGSPHGALRASALTALLIASLPIGIVESITTQTDYSTACWFLTLLLFSILLLKDPGHLGYAVGLGAALGLGILTKVTTLLYAAPWMAFLMGWLVLRGTTSRRRWQAAFIVSLLVVPINAPHMIRNFNLVGSPLSCPYILSVERNKTVSMGATASSLVRNLALHASSGIAPLTHAINTVLDRAHQWTGQDPNDPDTTYHGTQFQYAGKLLIFDSSASCFPHLLAIVSATLIALTRPRRHGKLLGYVGLIAASGLMFCALLRWQPWHARIHLTYFVALLPIAGTLLNTLRPRWLLLPASLVLVQIACFSILNNHSRPILDPNFTSLPRERQYGKIYAHEFGDAAALAIRDILNSGATRIGLRLRFNDPEQVFWILLQQNQFKGRMDHYMPFDASDRLDIQAPDPEVLITTWRGGVAPKYTQGYPHKVDYGWLLLHWSDDFKPPQRFVSQPPQPPPLQRAITTP